MILFIVLFVPIPVSAFRLGGITHRQYGIDFLQVAFLYLISLIGSPDIFVLQTEAVLLVYFANLLRHLSFFDTCKFC